MAGQGQRTRVEHDLLGAEDVPVDALWGIHSLRAVSNFAIGRERLSDVPTLIVALASVKEAAARTNRDLGLLPPDLADAIVWACQELRAGRHDDQFVVPLLQGGAGTSTNMNANEVIANLALRRLGLPPGTYATVHPNEHVNLGQSTNDVYPTALKLTLISAVDGLVATLGDTRAVLLQKADEFAGHVKMGRTQLQDAVPMTLGQEFGGYAVTILEDMDRLTEAASYLREINLGATAIGTGLNAHPEYAALVCTHLAEIVGVPLTTSADLIEATQDCGVFVLVSGVLKRSALKLSKICSDLRLLSSGPRAGLAEIVLPPRQAGSSIMPGKVNPVLPEFVNQVAFEIVGADVTISMAAESGQLQLNAFEPVIGAALVRGFSNLTHAVRLLTTLCISGITADRTRLRGYVERSIGTVTALSPVIGYHLAGEVALEALRTDRAVTEVILERGLLDPVTLERLLAPDLLTGAALPTAKPALHTLPL